MMLYNKRLVERMEERAVSGGVCPSEPPPGLVEMESAHDVRSGASNFREKIANKNGTGYSSIYC